MKLLILLFTLVNANNYDLLNWLFSADIIDNQIIINHYKYNNSLIIMFDTIYEKESDVLCNLNKENINNLLNFEYNMNYDINLLDENYLNVSIKINSNHTKILGLSINRQININNNIFNIGDYRLISNELFEINNFNNYLYIHFPNNKMIYNFVIKYNNDKLSIR